MVITRRLSILQMCDVIPSHTSRLLEKRRTAKEGQEGKDPLLLEGAVLLTVSRSVSQSGRRKRW